MFEGLLSTGLALFYLFINQFWDKLVELVSEGSFIRGAAACVDYFFSTHFSPIEDKIFFEKNIFLLAKIKK